MATVGQLNVNVNARTARFTKKMQSASMRLKAFGAGVGRLGKRLGMMGAIAGGIAVAALTALTKSSMAAMDATTKLARSIGISTEAMVGLQHAAAISGLSIKEIDKSIAQMARRIGEASMGISEATEALDALGLKASDMVNLSPDQMFGQIADAINQIPSAAQRASISYDLFGRAGIKLLNTMAGGSAGIEAMIEEAKALGIAYDELGGQKVEAANDAFHRMGSTMRGLGNQLAIEFAPMLVAGAEGIKNFVLSLGGMQPVAEFVAKGVIFAGSAILDIFKAIGIGWHGLSAAVIEGAAMITRAFATVGEFALSSSMNIGGWFAGVGADIAKAAGFEGLAGGLRGMESGLGAAAEHAGKAFHAHFKGIGDGLSAVAADEAQMVIDSLDEGWNLGKVEDRFAAMRAALESAIGAGGTPLAIPIELEEKGPASKNLVQTISTVMGAFKLGGTDRQTKLLEDGVDADKKSAALLASIDEALRGRGLSLV